MITHHSTSKVERFLLCSMMFVWLSHSPDAQAQLVLDVGNFNLLRDTAEQPVSVYVRNDGALPVELSALDFAVQIADGGPDAGGAIPGPAISAVTLTLDTVFSDNNSGDSDHPANTSQLQFWSTTESGSTPLPSLLPGLNKIAAIVLDTTGFQSGVWTLSVSGNSLGNTVLYDAFGSPLPVTINAGTISVAVPETPSAQVATVLLASFAVWRKIRQRREVLRPLKRHTDDFDKITVDRFNQFH
jgi:hypothetical protein